MYKTKIPFHFQWYWDHCAVLGEKTERVQNCIAQWRWGCNLQSEKIPQNFSSCF